MKRRRDANAHRGGTSAAATSRRLVLFLPISLSLLPALSSSAIEATFTPNPNDSVENGGSGSGPLPASAAQRRRLLELDAAIAGSDDPPSTLERVARQNGMSSRDLASVLDRNRHDLGESGQQLDGMLGEAAATMATAVGGGGGGGGGISSSSSLPRRILGLAMSFLVALIRTASSRASRHPRRSAAIAVALACALLAARDAPRNGVVISGWGTFRPPFARGFTTLLEPPMDYLERRFVDRRRGRGGGGAGWTSSSSSSISLPPPPPPSKKKKKKEGSKHGDSSSSSSSSSSRTAVGGVGMTRRLEIDDESSRAEEGEVTVRTKRSDDGFRLITTARTIMRDFGVDVETDENDGKDEGGVDDDESELLRLEATECMRQSMRSIIRERKFSEFIPGDSPSLKFRSFLVPSEDDDDDDDDDDVVEGAVMAMKFLGDFGRYGVQPFCISYETGDEDDNDAEVGGEQLASCVAFHTLAGGHFDGELRFSVEERNDAVVVGVTLAIPDGGRAPPVRLAEAMVSSFAESIAQSSRIRTRQTLARRRQSRNYRARVSGRASLKRHMRYEQERLQEEMAAERKRKWKRNNPDAGHYRPSGHRLKSPNNC